MIKVSQNLHNYPSFSVNMQQRLWTGSVKIYAFFSETELANTFVSDPY